MDWIIPLVYTIIAIIILITSQIRGHLDMTTLILGLTLVTTQCFYLGRH